MSTVLASEGRITDEAIARLRERVGTVRFERRRQRWESVSLDTIRHYATAIGDRNPNWEAAGIAPPTILSGFDRMFTNGVVDGLPGVHFYHVASTWTWEERVRAGDTITSEVVLREVNEKRSTYAGGGRSIHQIYETTFRNQREEVVSRLEWRILRAERSASRSASIYAGRTLHQYTPEEVAKIFDEYRDVQPAGEHGPRWSRVRVGDRIPPTVKGPLTATQEIAYEAFHGTFILGPDHTVDLFERHPALGVANENGVPEPPQRVHWDNKFAHDQVGLPGAYDAGMERTAWVAHALTNWMGDHGMLRRIHVNFRRFNFLGDTTWCDGTVTGTREENGRRLVDCEIRAVNQLGEVTLDGTATVELPE